MLTGGTGSTYVTQAHQGRGGPGEPHPIPTNKAGGPYNDNWPGVPLDQQNLPPPIQHADFSFTPKGTRRKSEHQQRVEEFMHKAGQKVPDHPQIPSEEVRRLRARLVFEEAVRELIMEGLAVAIKVTSKNGTQYIFNEYNLKYCEIEFVIDGKPNLQLIADGCADTSVVNIGTLSACGIADMSLLEEVDRSNLAKFELPKCGWHPDLVMKHDGNGSYSCSVENCKWTEKGPYRSPEGKWIKGPDWKAPDIERVLKEQIQPEPVKSENDPICLLKEAQRQLLVSYPAFAKAVEQIIKDFKNLRFKQTYTPPAANDSLQYDSGGIELCPNCKNPLSDEMLRKMRATYKQGVISTGKCPGCLQSFTLVQLGVVQGAKTEQ